MEIDKGEVEFLGKKFHCKVIYPEPKPPITAWLDKHKILILLRGDMDAYKNRNLKDVLLKLSNGKELRYNCCSVCTPGFMPPKEKTAISIHRNCGWGGKRIKDYKVEEWEAYNHVPCSLSWNLIKYHLEWFRMFLHDIFYYETIYRFILCPFYRLIFNNKRCNFKWNKVNNYVIMELLDLRQCSQELWETKAKDCVHIVYPQTEEQWNESFERLSLITEGQFIEKERKATIKRMKELDSLSKEQRINLWRSLNSFKNKYNV